MSLRTKSYPEAMKYNLKGRVVFAKLLLGAQNKRRRLLCLGENRKKHV